MRKIKRLTEREIDKKIEAIVSLQSDWRWKVFMEVIQYYQGFLYNELIGKRFTALAPIEKDREHSAIVRSLKALDFVLDMPNWLGKRKMSRWEDVAEQVRKETENARRK
jgi:hypothetical protein